MNAVSKPWVYVLQAFEAGSSVEGVVVRESVDGLEVEVAGLNAFVFAEKLGMAEGGCLVDYVGKTLLFKIIKAEPGKQRIMLSRKAVLDEEGRPERLKKLIGFEVGSLVSGVVERIGIHGALVNLGDGVTAMIHVRDVAEENVGHASKVLGLGQRIVARVLNIDTEKARMSLGLKQVGDPWNDFLPTMQLHAPCTGIVRTIKDYGVFIEMAPGVDGLLHVSRMVQPAKAYKVGDTVEVELFGVDAERKRMDLAERVIPQGAHA